MCLLALCAASVTPVMAAVSSGVYVVCPTGVSGVQVQEIDLGTGSNTTLVTIPELKSYLAVTAVVDSNTFLLAQNMGTETVYEVAVQNRSATPTAWAGDFNAIGVHGDEFYGRTRDMGQTAPAKWFAGSLSGGTAGGHVVSTLAEHTMYPPGGSYDAINDRFHFLGQPDFHQYLHTDMKSGKTTTLDLPKTVFLESVAWDSKNSRLLGLGITDTSHDCAFFEINPDSGATNMLFQTPGVVCSFLTSTQYEPIEARWYIYFGPGNLLAVGVEEKKVLTTTKIKAGCTAMAVL